MKIRHESDLRVRVRLRLYNKRKRPSRLGFPLLVGKKFFKRGFVLTFIDTIHP